jgi:hypothetical protein
MMVGIGVASLMISKVTSKQGQRSKGDDPWLVIPHAHAMATCTQFTNCVGLDSVVPQAE